VIVDINDKERFQHTLPKEYFLISHQEEDNLNLDEVLQIIDKQNVLYIKRTSKMDWSNLIDMCE
ncbi:2080_t:CDS:2, partial [Gigaspora margarita]